MGRISVRCASLRELIVSFLVVVWALRLSSFLYFRIQRTGKDGRFDQLKTSPVRFLVPWTIQGLWVFLTAIVVLVINSQAGPAPELGVWDAVGLSVWCVGFGVEVVADNQKSAFNREPMNEGKWIDRGLWSYSRHPNYLGNPSLDGNRVLWNLLLFGPRTIRLDLAGVCFPPLDEAQWNSHARPTCLGTVGGR